MPDKFRKIIHKYQFNEDKAGEIADYLTKNPEISTDEFARLFNISVEDAKYMLEFIHKASKLREKYLKDNEGND